MSRYFLPLLVCLSLPLSLGQSNKSNGLRLLHVVVELALNVFKHGNRVSISLSRHPPTGLFFLFTATTNRYNTIISSSRLSLSCPRGQQLVTRVCSLRLTSWSLQPYTLYISKGWRPFHRAPQNSNLVMASRASSSLVPAPNPPFSTFSSFGYIRLIIRSLLKDRSCASLTETHPERD